MYFREKTKRVCAFQVPTFVNSVEVNWRSDGVEGSRSFEATPGDWLVFIPGSFCSVVKDKEFRDRYEKDA